MAKKPPKYFWDTNIFIAVLQGDGSCKAHVLDSAKCILEDMEQGQAVIIASSMILAEVLSSTRLSVEDGKRFHRWANSSHLSIQDVNVAVALKVASIREAILTHAGPDEPCRQCGRRPDSRSWPDLIHVATAMLYEEELSQVHSFDSDFQKLLTRAGSKLLVREPSHPRAIQKSFFS